MTNVDIQLGPPALYPASSETMVDAMAHAVLLLQVSQNEYHVYWITLS